MKIVSRLASLLLAGFAVAFFPISLACLCLNYAVLALDLRPKLRGRLIRNQGFKQRTVLLTGIGTPQGLHLARALHATGHTVVGAEHGQKVIPAHARFSNAVHTFRSLRHSLADQSASECTVEILDLIEKYNIELWIDCSQQRMTEHLKKARSIIDRNSRCLCFLPSGDLSTVFSSTDALLEYARGQGLPGLDSRQVGSRAEIHNVLNDSRGKKRYVLSSPDASPVRTLLPRRTLSQTYNEISKVQIQNDKRWCLKQHVETQERYTTIAVVVEGELKCFAASPLATFHGLQALPKNSALNSALLSYVSVLCEKLGHGFTGHFSVDFCVDEMASAAGVEKAILPVGGRMGPNAPLLLFQGLDGSLDLARSYLSIFKPMANGAARHSHQIHNSGPAIATPTRTDKGLYSFGHEYFQLVLLPTMQMLKLKMGVVQVLRSMTMFANHLVFWGECLYDFKDPLPFWWLYQVYIPTTLVSSSFKKQSEPLSTSMQLIIR